MSLSMAEDIPRPGEGVKGYQVAGSKTIPYESEEERQEFLEGIQEADMILVGNVDKVVRMNVGAGALSVPVTQIYFKNMKAFKGEIPQTNVFRYAQPPETLRMDKKTKVIALMKKRFFSKEYQVAEIFEATKAKMTVVEAVAASRKVKVPGNVPND
ncbi:MAG: hypothetical protein JW893_05805 [Candidatus Omnitrophica bacterium]|nr:hypothetical protein [Candidatus Omnitrophota bacterium]